MTLIQNLPTAIIKTEKTELSKLGIDLHFYTVWDKDESRFIRSKLPFYIYRYNEDIPLVYRSHRYEIVEMNLDIPDDFKRIVSLCPDLFQRDEKMRMLNLKFNQLIKVFLFNNDELIEKMKTLHPKEKPLEVMAKWQLEV